MLKNIIIKLSNCPYSLVIIDWLIEFISNQLIFHFVVIKLLIEDYLYLSCFNQDQKILNLMMKRRKDQKMELLKNAIVEQVNQYALNYALVIINTKSLLFRSSSENVFLFILNSKIYSYLQ